jgi:hypothetical protein
MSWLGFVRVRRAPSKALASAERASDAAIVTYEDVVMYALHWPHISIILSYRRDRLFFYVRTRSRTDTTQHAYGLLLACIAYCSIYTYCLSVLLQSTKERGGISPGGTHAVLNCVQIKS